MNYTNKTGATGERTPLFVMFNPAFFTAPLDLDLDLARPAGAYSVMAIEDQCLGHDINMMVN